MNIINPKLNFRTQLQKANNTHEYIIIHHALAKNCTVQDIHSWHLDRGFIGIGYHFFVRKNGEIYQGRDINWQGGHCSEQQMNIKSIGICVEGCYEEYSNQTDKIMPDVQLKALESLVKYLINQYKIPINKIKKHHDFNLKLCPGNYFPWNKFISDLEVNPLLEIKKEILRTISILEQRIKASLPIDAQMNWLNKQYELYLKNGGK